MEDPFANVPKDILIMMALDLDLPSLYSLCRSDASKNRILCASSIFWRKKLEQDYPKIDITDIKSTNYKPLYEYLTLKPKNIKDGELGSLSHNRKAVLGAGGVYYTVGNEAYQRNFLNSGITFPTFPPDFMSNFTNIVLLHRDTSRQVAKNEVNNKSYVTGNFGEKYNVTFAPPTDDKYLVTHNKILNDMKDTISSHKSRYKNGEFYINFVDLYKDSY